MSSRIYQHVISPAEAALVAGNMVNRDFSAALDMCAQEFRCGRYIIVFPDNLHVRYGGVLCEYFRHTLSQRIGAPVYLNSTVDSNGSKSLIQMGHLGVSQQPLDLQPANYSQTTTSDISAGTTATVVAGKKKVPRPLNMFMLFRIELHEELKAANPDMPVQEISKRCSNAWRSFSKDEKKIWKKRADDAAQLHKELHPDYKYQPRKVGEKKKRQSRKAKLAAAAATAVTDSATTPSAPIIDATTASPTNVDHDTSVDAVAFFGSDDQEFSQPDELFTTESIRQDRLQAEFDAEFSMDLPGGLFNEVDFGFRTGAELNLTNVAPTAIGSTIA